MSVFLTCRGFTARPWPCWWRVGPLFPVGPDPGFPDGQLYADLAWSSGGPGKPAGLVSSYEVLGRFLGALGVPPWQVPACLSERVTLYRSLTATRAVAVILDNALSAEQVASLLPASADSVTVMPTMQQLSNGLMARGAVRLGVDALDHAGSIALLGSHVDGQRLAAEPSQADTLVSLCERRPALLCLVGSHLARHPHRRFAHVVAELLHARKQLIDLSYTEDPAMTATLDFAYDTLDPDEQEAYRLIGLHPGTEFGPEVIAAVLDTDRADAERRLDALVGASLATRLSDGYCQVSDEVHAHAAEQATEHAHECDHPDAVARIAAWYLHGALVANCLAMPRRRVWDYEFDESVIAAGAPAGIQDRRSALSWLERNRTPLIAAVQQTFEHGWCQLTCHLADACLVLFIKHGHVQDTVTVCKLGYEGARILEDVEAQMSFLKRLARAHATLGNLDQADKCVEIMGWLATGDPWREANRLKYSAFTKTRRGIEAANNGARDEAITLWREATCLLQGSLAIIRALGDPRSEGLTLTDLGEVWLHLGDTTTAIETLNQARHALDSADEDSYNRARVDDLHGRALAEAAREYLNRALHVFHADGAAHYVTHTTQALADLPQ